MFDNFETTKEFKTLLEEAIKVYLEQGIVTRKDISSMNIRSTARLIFDHLVEQFSEANSAEFQVGNYFDYSTVIYDTDRFTYEEAEKYTLKYILS